MIKKNWSSFSSVSRTCEPGVSNYFEVKVKNKVNIHLICHFNDDIRSLKGRLKEKSSRLCCIFLRAIFCPKKENENVCLGKKAPLSTISFERSILEKNAESRPPLFFNFSNYFSTFFTFFQKTLQESKPTLKLKNNGGLLSDSLKRYCVWFSRGFLSNQIFSNLCSLF